MDAQKLRDHLKHIIYVDFVSIHEALGFLNHNAADRCMCYEKFEEDEKSPDFEKRFAEMKTRYEQMRAGVYHPGSVQELERVGAARLAGPQEQPMPRGEWSMEWSGDPEQYAEDTATKFLEWRAKRAQDAPKASQPQ